MKLSPRYDWESLAWLVLAAGVALALLLIARMARMALMVRVFCT